MTTFWFIWEDERRVRQEPMGIDASQSADVYSLFYTRKPGCRILGRMYTDSPRLSGYSAAMERY